MFHDTIAAIATPIGESGIGVVRLSGPDAKAVALKVLRKPRGGSFADLQDHRLYYGRVVDPAAGRPVDEVLFFYAAGPRSFTAEDTVEIQAHGSMFIVQQILELLLAHGARLAGPGEFTQRAFLNGRIDLVQAEAVIDLIRAKTEKAHQLALSQLSGKASQQIHWLEAGLYSMLINIEAVLDFPEEGIPEPQQLQIREQTQGTLAQLRAIYAKVEEGRKIKEGVAIVITGRPNVGKSSILNALLQEEKAIVTDIPGTTRDAVEGLFQLRGIPIRLLDTAGLRPTDNPIERLGIDKAHQLLDQADLILLILDNSAPLTEEDRAIVRRLNGRPFVLIINKTDLPSQLNRDDLKQFNALRTLQLSVVDHQGFDQLEQTIAELVGIGSVQVDDQPVLSSVRQKEALRKAIEALQSFGDGLESGITEDLLAVDLRSCLSALGEITGKNVDDEVLHGIFAQFCIGK